MKLFIFSCLLLTAAPSFSNAQVKEKANSTTCAECGLPPGANGTGGLTCSEADAVFSKTHATYSVDKESLDGVSYQMTGQVHCGSENSFGIVPQGTQTETLSFSVTEKESALSEETFTEVGIHISNILGLSELEQNAFGVITPKGTEDLSFGRYRYGRQCWNKRNRKPSCDWVIPISGRFFVKYWCKAVTEDSSKLLCKVFHEGKTFVGYESFSSGGSVESTLDLNGIKL